MGCSPWGRKKLDPTEANWHVHILAFVEHILIIQKRAVKVFPGGLVVRIPGSHFRRCGCQVQSLGREDPLEEGMATHSSILAWRIPWTGGPGGLQSIGLQKVRHD